MTCWIRPLMTCSIRTISGTSLQYLLYINKVNFVMLVTGSRANFVAFSDNYFYHLVLIQVTL